MEVAQVIGVDYLLVLYTTIKNKMLKVITLYDYLNSYGEYFKKKNST